MNIEQLIDTYSDYLYRIAFIYTKDRLAAEEVVQDVFLNFYHKSDQFEQKASIKTYLVKMTINRSYDYLRSWKNKKFAIFQLFQPYEKGAEQIYVEKELQGEVTAAVLALPVKDREVLLLYYYEEMTVIEIAELLQLAVSTVKSRLQRARAKLRPKLSMEVMNDE
ncbi:sigma-70 family RNA polymerase sigma factor [Solibacillus sp. A46]|uniref:Sigma-70 family RNA polymerase sigma factor n=1 Tax=Solibacillus faecavium TaxID=2762221 RepID=A0ABR8XYZ2_9BACL|nr:sigma-70 family RNA polymerase sigma factor [Solibacillus faecavium]MBD8037153.1 sigma-70 family RNA polymerase sigma factor [Solibacillus faecavium]